MSLRTQRIFDFGIHSPSMVLPLSRFFRFGTPTFAVLHVLGVVPWWLIIVPVMPVWWSMVTTTYEARQRQRIILRPKRSMSFAEAAAERKYLFADAALLQAQTERAEALAELAAARAVGRQNSAAQTSEGK